MRGIFRESPRKRVLRIKLYRRGYKSHTLSSPERTKKKNRISLRFRCDKREGVQILGDDWNRMTEEDLVKFLNKNVFFFFFSAISGTTWFFFFFS